MGRGSWIVNSVTPANVPHFVTPVYTGVQANLFLVVLVSGFRRNDELASFFERSKQCR